MLELLFTLPALPLAGFLVLALAGRRLPRPAVAAVGAGSVIASAVAAFAVAASYLTAHPTGGFTQPLWRWFEVGGLAPELAFHLDPLSLVMVLVVTGVGALIHLYSVEQMAGEEGYARFFAAMNLFVASMLVLVLADDLLFLYLGWEGVGLCSYLLIGFWYQDPANGRAARKAFLVTRIGDAAMAVALFLLYTELGTLEISAVLERAPEAWDAGSAPATWAAALLLVGALGKSAQLPLQVWLPDAMAGPSPTSALIHAATMVTAGVYLVARTGELFALAPGVQAAVAVVGAATLLLAAASALAQNDVKRVLAYSTVSQIGYMFLALGVGASAAAVFHLMTHAFFKALLFLGAGAVLYACGGEHDVFALRRRYGDLRRQLPVTFATFTVAAAALAGVPLVTAGFFSKDLILERAWTAGAHGLWAIGVAGAFLTGLYAFRLVFLLFFGERRGEVERRPGWRIRAPLVILGALSILGGWLEVPSVLAVFGDGGVHLFTGFLGAGEGAAHLPGATAALLLAATSAAALLGIGLAWHFFLRRPRTAGNEIVLPGADSPAGARLLRWWREGWGFDRLYDFLFVRPFVAVAAALRADPVDRLPTALALGTRAGHRFLAHTQNGRLRWYAATVACGAAAVIYLTLAW